MLQISDKAKNRIRQIREAEGQDANWFVRVSITSGGCSGLSYNMDFDNSTKETDEVFEDNDEKIVCDAKSLLYLIGTTLDFSEGLDGKGFFFDNPNASRTCSCGESFSL